MRRWLFLVMCLTACGSMSASDDDGIGHRDPRAGRCVPEGSPARETWPPCQRAACIGLSETRCKSEPGCQAIYETSLPETYRDCVPTAAEDEAPFEGCEALSAEVCAEHDSCAVLYHFYEAVPQVFASCWPELQPFPPPLPPPPP